MKKAGNPWVLGALIALGGATTVWAISGKPIPFTDEWRATYPKRKRRAKA